MASKAFLDQVVASCRLLDSLRATPPLLDQVAPTQSDHLLRLAGEVLLDAGEMATIIEQVQGSSFPETCKTTLLAAIASRFRSVVAAPGKAAKNQDFTSLPRFLKATVWESMRESPVELIKHLQALGLRQPSEPTFQMACVLQLVAQRGVEGAVNYSVEATKFKPENI